nr:formin-like protein 14 [Aegilops tauschii subsp. strangulata]
MATSPEPPRRMAARLPVTRSSPRLPPQPPLPEPLHHTVSCPLFPSIPAVPAPGYHFARAQERRRRAPAPPRAPARARLVSRAHVVAPLLLDADARAVALARPGAATPFPAPLLPCQLPRRSEPPEPCAVPRVLPSPSHRPSLLTVAPPTGFGHASARHNRARSCASSASPATSRCARRPHRPSSPPFRRTALAAVEAGAPLVASGLHARRP